MIARQLSPHLPPAPCRVLDLGAGDGEQGIRLARRGFEVTLLDAARAMVEAAERRLVHEDPETVARVRIVHGRAEDARRLTGPDRFDLVLCHALLPYIPDPTDILEIVADRAADAVSVAFKNAEALAMRAGLEGRFVGALGHLHGDPEHDDGGQVLHGHTLAQVRDAAAGVGIELDAWYGVQTFTAHRHDVADEETVARAVAVEDVAGRRDPYRGVARQLHVLGHQRSGQ